MNICAPNNKFGLNNIKNNAEINFAGNPQRQFATEFGPVEDTFESKTPKPKSGLIHKVKNVIQGVFQTRTEEAEGGYVNVEEVRTEDGTLKIGSKFKINDEGKRVETLYNTETGKKICQIPTYEELTDKGIDEFDAKDILNKTASCIRYAQYLKEGYAEIVSANMAILNTNLEAEHKRAQSPETIAPLIEDLTRFSEFNTVHEDILELIKSSCSENIFEDFIKYYQENIDFDQLIETAPEISRFDTTSALSFLKYHFYNQTTTFDKTTLKFEKPLSTYLKNAYMDGDNLNALLCSHPMTQREIGSLPEDWAQKGDEEAFKKVCDSISKFQKTKSKKGLQEDLSSILNKDVTVEYIGKGTFGTGYKIEAEGIKPVCLKIFDGESNTVGGIHGQHIEVQTALFVNNHSNDYVKFHFGRTAAFCDEDGFLVTDYLKKGIEPLECNPEEIGAYQIDSRDTTSGRNKINGKIMDFGATIIRTKEGRSAIRYFNGTDVLRVPRNEQETF